MTTRTLGIKFEVVGFKGAVNSIEELKRGIRASVKANIENFNATRKLDREIAKTIPRQKPNQLQTLARQNVRNLINKNNIHRLEKQQRTKNLFKDNKFTSSEDEFRVWRTPRLENSLIRKFISSLTKKSRNQLREYRDKGDFAKPANTNQKKGDPSCCCVETDNEDDFVDNYQQAFTKMRKGDIKGGIFQWIRKPLNSILSGYYEAIGGEFGAKVGQRLMGARSSSVSSVRNRGRNGDRITLDLNSEQFKSLADAFVTRFNRSSEINNNRVNLNYTDATGKNKESQGLINKVAEPVKFRFQSLMSGYFEGIGNYFGEQFASGLSETLEEDLNYSQKRKGRVMGKTIGFVANDGMENLEEKFDTLKLTIASLADDTEKIDIAKIRKALAALFGIPTSVADSYLTGFRRSSVKEEAIRQVDKNKASFNEDISDIKSKKKAIVTASGFAGEKGKQGRKQAERLRELNQDENTVVLSSDTPFTDVAIKPSNAISGAAWGLNALANAASINLKGFNPDALEMVNKVLKLREENPDIDINLVGHSAGGFVVEEAQYLLEELGVKNTSATTIGTPNLKGGIKPKNIKRIFGENDPLQGLHTAAEVIDFVNNNYEKDSISKGHFFDQYLESPEVRKAIFNRQKYDNTGTRVSSDRVDNNPVAEVASVVGDAVVTALSTNGDVGVKAAAFSGVIVEAAVSFRDSVIGAGSEFLNNIKIFDGSLPSFSTLNPVEQLDRLSKEIIKVIAEALDRAIRGYRRQVLKTVAAPFARSRSEEILKSNKSKSGAGVTDRDSTLFIVVSGHHGRDGMGGALVAKAVKDKIKNKSGDKVIWIKNADSDIPADSITGDSQAAKALSYGKPRIRGYSKDALEGAAQALAANAKNPNIEIKIVGYSAGADVADEIVELLNILGLKNVSGVGMGNVPMTGSFSPSNFDYYIGENDTLYPKMADLAEYGIATIDVESERVSDVTDHDFVSYANSDAGSEFFTPGKYNAKTSVGKAKKFRDLTDRYLHNWLFGGTVPDLSRLQKEKKILERRANNAGDDSAVILREAMKSIDAVINRFGEEENNSETEQIRQISREIAIATATDYRSTDLLPSQSALSSIQSGLGNEAVDRVLRSKIDRLLDTIERAIASKTVQIQSKKDRFAQFLQSRSSFTPEQIEQRRSEYQNLNASGRREYIGAIRGALNTRIAEYRRAIKNNNLLLAKEIAVSLLNQVSIVKQVYRDIAESLPDGDELKNIVRGNQSYLTAVENEIMRGQPNQVSQGRIGVGLPDIYEEQLTFQDRGGDVVDGFIEGIIAEIAVAEEAGREIISATERGVTEEGEIKSPSRLFARLGRFVVEGFRQGVSSISSVGDELEQRGRNAIATAAEGIEDEIEAIEDEIGNTDTPVLGGLGQFADSLLQQYPLLNKFKGVIGAIAGLFLGGMGIGAITSALNNLSKELFTVASAAETMDRSIIFISRNVDEGAKSLQFVSETARQLGIDLNNAKKNYASFIGAAKDTSLEGLQTEQVFTAFAETASLRGLDSESTDRLFTALSQIIAKRKITAEEARGQIGDIAGFGDFMGLVAQAQGVSTRQIEDMMSRGELSIDILPKIAAILQAQNAMAGSFETAQTAQNKYNNSLTQFQATLGSILMPIQKIILKIKTIGLDTLTDRLNILFQILVTLSGTVLLALLKDIKLIPTVVKSITFAVNGLVLALKRLWAAKGIIAEFAAGWLLVSVAIESVKNAYSLTQNEFTQINKDVKNLTSGFESLKVAIDEANQSSKSLTNNLPQQSKDLELGEGAFGVSWLNLDTLARKPINRVLDFFNVQKPDISTAQTQPSSPIDDPLGERQFDQSGFDMALSYLLSGRLTTQAERKEADFLVATSDYQMIANSILMETYNAKNSASKIVEYDTQIAKIQSQRLSLLPGDTEALNNSLEAEKKLQKERDKQLKILTQQQENLQLTIEAGKRSLDELEALAKSGGITESNYNNQKATIENTIADAEDDLKDVNDIISRLPKQLSEFSRRLRNASERVAGFIEERDRISTQERTDIISKGVATGQGEQTIQIELEGQSQRDLEKRIKFLQTEINKVEQDLGSAALNEGLQRVEEAAQNSGGLTTEVINRMLEQERDQQEKEALSGALKVREMQTQLYGYQEQFAQSIQQSRSSLIDFNRTIEDYFFNLIQRIKEARLETQTLISQVFATKIKNQLRSAIAPGSDSFVNGIIDGIQGILDQAQSLIERSLGIDGTQLQFESEARSLELEMQDFIRSIGGATDAIDNFGNRINILAGNVSADGITNADNNRVNSANHNNHIEPRQSDSAIVTNLRRAIIGKESAGKFNAVNPHSGALGYGQVMPANVASWTREATGRAMSPKAFLSNPGAQIKTIDYKLKQYLDRELKATGGDVGTAVRRVASTWYSGRPELYNNTRPQTYGAGKYPSINDYTADILKRFNSVGGREASPVSNPKNNTINNSNSNQISRAKQKTDELLGVKSGNINLQEILQKLDLDGSYKQTIASEKEKIRRTFELEGLQNENKGLDLEDRLAEFQSRSSLTTAESEMLAQLRSTATEFRNIKIEGVQELLRVGDTVANLKGITEVFPQLIDAITASGNSELVAAIPVLEEALNNAREQLPEVTAQLGSVTDNYRAIAEQEEKAIAFLRRQGELKIEAESLSKRSQLVQIKTNIATQRGTNELRRQNELAVERLRLEQRINEIRQQYGDSDFTKNLIQLERQNSLFNRENIDRSAEDRDLQYEQKLLQMDSGIASGRGQSLSAVGNVIEANRVQREAAIAQENLRYKQELIELERAYGSNIAKLEELKQKALVLNQVNLEGINLQFKSLGDTIKYQAVDALQNFFSQWLQNLDNGKELFKQFVKTVLDGIARMLMQMAIAKIMGVVLGGIGGAAMGGGGATSSLNFDAGSAAFTASDGITVPNYKDGGTTGNRIVKKPISDRLIQMSQPIKSAFKREGSKGVLGVFTPGEEILSIKTGEAPRYQALKNRLGSEPLEKIFAGNFLEGGTIESNLLSQLNTSTPSINVGAIKTPSSQSVINNNVTNFSASIVTPNADSFRESSYQRQQDIAEALIRAKR